MSQESMKAAQGAQPRQQWGRFCFGAGVAGKGCPAFPTMIAPSSLPKPFPMAPAWPGVIPLWFWSMDADWEGISLLTTCMVN